MGYRKNYRDCCLRCATLYRVIDDQIAWRRDHFFERTAEEQLSESGYAIACDVDSSGNIYQSATWSVPLVMDGTLPQDREMWVLRSYTEGGSLRWSWSAEPFGTVDGFNVRGGPQTGVVRCGGTSVFFGDAVGKGTAFDQDGNILWSQTIADPAHPLITVPFDLIAAGPTRTLWVSIAPTVATTALILDHAGNKVFSASFGSSIAEAFWLDPLDQTWFAIGGGIVGYDSSGAGISNINGGTAFNPTYIRSDGVLLAAANATEFRIFDAMGFGAPLETLLGTSERPKFVSNDRVGTTRLNSAIRSRLRNIDLTANRIWTGTSDSVVGLADAMPADAGSVWCGTRDCGVSLIAE